MIDLIVINRTLNFSIHISDHEGIFVMLSICINLKSYAKDAVIYQQGGYECIKQLIVSIDWETCFIHDPLFMLHDESDGVPLYISVREREKALGQLKFWQN